MIAGKFVVCVAIGIGKVEHFICVIPACGNISGHHLFGQWCLALGLTVGQKTVPMFGHFSKIDAYLSNHMVKSPKSFRHYSI